MAEYEQACSQSQLSNVLCGGQLVLYCNAHTVDIYERIIQDVIYPANYVLK